MQLLSFEPISQLFLEADEGILTEALTGINVAYDNGKSTDYTVTFVCNISILMRIK